MKARRLPLRMGCGEPLVARLPRLRRPAPSRPRREEKRS